MRDWTKCDETDKLTGVGQMSGVKQRVRSQKKCQESEKMSGFGQNVRNQKNCLEYDKILKGRKKCQETGKN